MRRYQFRCKVCSTFVSIETELPEDMIHHVPPCPCGLTRLDLEEHAVKDETGWDA